MTHTSMHPAWEMLHPEMTMEHLGFLPGFLHVDDERSAREQFDSCYQHGGGWRPFKGFKVVNEETQAIAYPGDPAMKPVAKAHLRDETIYFYPHSWVRIVQPDGSWEICRMD